MGSSLKMNIFLSSLILSSFAVLRVHSAQEMEIRLMYGLDSTEGAVFVYKDDRWWPICGESWTLDEAKVACNQLGFPYPYAESDSLPDYIFINVSRGRNWLVGFRCRGYESKLKWCSYSGWGYCNSGLAAGVTCRASTESDEFVPKYVWVIFFLVAGCFMTWAFYKKKRERHQQEQLQQQQQLAIAQETTLHLQYPSSMDESSGSPLEAGNQGYPASPVIRNTTGFNGWNSKNTTNVTLPLPQNQQGHLPMATAPAETLNTTGIEGSVPGNPAWGVSWVPPSAPPPAGFAPFSSANQMQDLSLQQGFPHYPTQDPHSQDMPPPPSYEEATHQNP